MTNPHNDPVSTPNAEPNFSPEVSPAPGAASGSAASGGAASGSAAPAGGAGAGGASAGTGSGTDIERAATRGGKEEQREETSRAKRKKDRGEKDLPDGKVQGSFAASTWAALIAGFLLLILLIVFILQNQQSVPLNFLGWTTQFPAGIAFLIFAIAGALIMALVGGWRMFELRRQVRKQARARR